MITNYEFGLIVREPQKIYINILNSFDYQENIVEINEKKYQITKKQFEELKMLIEKNLTKLIKISREQTPSFLDEYAVDGYAENITVLLGGMSVFVNFAVTNLQEYGNNLINSIIDIFIK